MIDNNELQCVLIVVSKRLVEEIEFLSTLEFSRFLNICKKTNCVIAIQEYLLEDKPIFHDFSAEEKYSIEDLEALVKEHETNVNLENPEWLRREKERDEYYKVLDDKMSDLSNSYFRNNETERFTIIPSKLDELDEYDVEAEKNETSVPKSYNGYYDAKRKLELLKETERSFPKAKEIISLLQNEFDSLLTFRYLTQLSDIVRSEIIEQFSNEILNIYIPNHYGYKFEFDDFVQLFEKYLKNIEQLNISVEINETPLGTNYKFISNIQRSSLSDLPDKFKRFTSFIDLCENQPEEAMQLLQDRNIPSDKGIEIINRLSKKYKRLVLDIQQQKERLELAYKQELQSELLEFGLSETPFSLVQNSFSIKTIESIYTPTEDEFKLMTIVKQYGDNIDLNNLKSDLSIIKDPGIKIDDRQKAGYKLKKTLSKILKKGIESTETIVVQSIINYINTKLS